MKYIVSILLFLYFGVTQSQVIDNSRGVDSRVDYESLKEFGPWDDRNYDLTLEDLAWLSSNESELREMVPAFYRVIFRQEFTDTATTGMEQYPRSFFNYFLLRFNGYLIDGLLYKKVKWDDERKFYVVITENGNSPGKSIRDNVRSLEGNVLINSGAESAISVSPVDPNIVVAGLNSNGQEMLFSSDGGETWTSAPDLTGSECCDPAMDWSSDGSFAYNVTLGGSQVWFYRSDDNGQSWNSLADITPGDNRRELTGPVNSTNDKEYIHVDKHDLSPFKDNIYITWHQGNILQFATSTDNGHSFSQLSFDDEPRGIGSDIVTDANGTIYHFWPSTQNQQIRMNKSTDGGISFSPSVPVSATIARFIFPIPSTDTRQVFIYTSADMDLTGGDYNQRLYVAWTDSVGAESPTPVNNHARIQVAFSDDAGDSWTTRTPHETFDAMNVDRWHQWLKVDKNGVVHITFYDTRQFAARNGVDMYHSFSIDGGNTWSTPDRLSTESSPASSGFEFGDYNGLDFGSDGKGIAIFSDNRAEGSANPDMDVYAASIAEVSPFPNKIFSNGFESDIIFANGFE